MIDKYNNGWIIEEEEKSICPECYSELKYEQSYDNSDLLMFCTNCYYVGVIKDYYKDDEVL